jgi:hypothetical protein
MSQNLFAIEPTGQSDGHCKCCGSESRTVWGNISLDGAMVACYFVHWTRAQTEHYPNLDFLIGSWGDNAKNDRVLVSWLYSASRQQFMVIDSGSRPAARSELCSQALTRAQVLASPELLQKAKGVLDAVWLGDKRIEEVKASDDA